MLEQQKLQQSRNIFSNEGQHRILTKIDLQSLKLRQMVNQLRGRSFGLDESLNNNNNNSELFSKQLIFQKRSYSKDDSQSRLKQKFNILSDRFIEKRSLPSKQLLGFNKNSKNLFFDSKSQRQERLKKHKNVSNITNLNINHQPIHLESDIQIDQSPIQQLIKKPTTTFFRIKQKPQLRKAQQNQQKKQGKLKHNMINNPQTGFEVQTLNHQIMVQFLSQKLNNLNPNSPPKQIYTFFEQIYTLWNIKRPSHPIIKRYKNCIYFGQKINEDDDKTYIGMVWYFKYSLYYGEFRNKKKNGSGIQISLKNGDQITVWKGMFEQGSKTGYFSIQSSKFKYFGVLKSGVFHGEGLLINNESQYKGGFVQNQKQGHGLQKFSNKSEYKGQYFNNKFDGEGEFKAPNYYYKGWFKKGRPDGYGFQRTAQYEYLGNFQKSKKHGKGIIKTADGIQIECIFKDGIIARQRINPNKSKEFKIASNDISKLKEQSSEDENLDQMNKNKLSEDDPLPFPLHL